jgi:ribosome-binding factor A
MSTHRLERIQHIIASAIGEMIVSRAVKDPRVDSLASVHRVVVSNDISSARIYISGYLDEHKLEKCVQGLNSAAGFIQKKLAAVLKTRRTPKLVFFVDTSVSDGFSVINDLLPQV